MADTISLESDDTTRADLRQKIAVMVGCRNNGGPLSKSTLNSVYAYLNGEFFYPRRVRHNPDAEEFVQRQEVFVAVAAAADVFSDDPSETWTTASGELPQSFRKRELRALAEEIQATDDNREWTQING